MNIERKNKTSLGSIIAAFCIVIYLFAMVQAAVRLYLSYEAINAFDINTVIRILKETLFIILIGFTIAFITMLVQLLTGKSGETAAPSYNRAPVQTKNQTAAYTSAGTAAPAESASRSLYSPRSNIGWEDYLSDRLESEIRRCSSSEQDLTLLIMEFTDIKNDEMYRHAAEETVAFFKSRDLLFEFEKYGIYVILPGVELESGIAKSQKFNQRIMEVFPSRYNSSPSLCIGLSSRAGRLLNAGRLMLESREALQKAKTDSESKIIAFKSDPDKYREFIRRQMQ